MQVLQQETILKTALSRNGVASPSIADARIIPTDQIRIPDVEPISPIQDLMAMALSSRPELAQSRIQIAEPGADDQGIEERAAADARRGGERRATTRCRASRARWRRPPGTVHSNNPFFIGGYGTVLSQLFSRNFPNYSAGFNLNIPIRNRSAQAQVINDELTLRQQQLGLQRLENQVRVDVQNALIGLTQARAQYQSAIKQRVLQAQTLDAEQKKLALGASTIYNVIQDQQALTAAESNEVAARGGVCPREGGAGSRDRADPDATTISRWTRRSKASVSRPPSQLPALADAPAQRAAVTVSELAACAASCTGRVRREYVRCNILDD